MVECTIDFETRSPVNLKTAGTYVYAEHPDTSVLCAAFAFTGDAAVHLWVPGDTLPPRLGDHVRGGGTVVAHNAQFERVIWRDILGPRHGWPVPAIAQYRCTMAQALAMALPGGLDDLAEALGVDQQKDKAGSALMLKMCKPRTPRKGEPDDALLWHETPEQLAALYEYCRQDVRTEMAVDAKLLKLRPLERRIWQLDQTINDRGIMVDQTLAWKAEHAIMLALKDLNRRISAVTDGAVQKVTEVSKVADFVADYGYTTDGLAKDVIDDLLSLGDLPHEVEEVLELRREGGKASVAKIRALLHGKSADGRAKGLLQYHSASTGRWAGRRFQPQNIKRPENKGEVSQVIDDLLALNVVDFLAKYDRPLTSVSDCIRGLVTTHPDYRIIARDYSNIEGRVLAWLAGEHWKLAAFRAFDAGLGPDLYKVTAAGILGKTPDQVDAGAKDGPERQAYGKVPELACGYQGGVGAFQNMARIYRVRVTDAEADEIKKGWRARHPGTVRLWHAYEEAAYASVSDPGTSHTVGSVTFVVRARILFCRLPSGRSLCYIEPEIREKAMPWIDPETGKRAKKLTVSYMGMNSYTRQWQREYIYGGKWAENVVSGTARDIMAESMLRVEAAGYNVVLSVHDEIVCENHKDDIDEAEFDSLVTTLPPWANGLPLAVGGFVAERYRK